MISLEQVSFGYEESQEILSGISTSIAPGECVLLCGASGCGKTTVTKLINGLIPAFTPGCRLDGRVNVDGLDPQKTPMYELARQVGSVFQNPKSQFFNLDTDSEVAFGLENEGRPPEEIRRRVSETMKALHINELQGRNIFSLSGGQKQLLAFASVYAMGPVIYVLDEPTANLDQEAISHLHDQIAYLKQQGHTVIIAEHRLYFLTDLIDRALYLRSGVLERIFTREEFCALSNQERERLELRTLIPAICKLPYAEPAGTETGLSVESLSCAFQKGTPVFRNLSFSARPGEAVAITGPNGVGKTTLSRCLCGLLREQSGRVLLHGKALDRKERQKVSFCVMQDVNHQLFSDSVWGECQMSAPDAPKEKFAEVLESLQLLPFRERHPMSLSGGQKQRLAVATALLSEKPVLIFDEPTSGLDYARMVEVSKVIRALVRQGRIVLVVTHDQEFMQRACDRVLRL
ncbi:ABC transporter ATP-binding protein [Solibaculum mannosilyticum]|uniref:ABC transporter ATP-binding protein n=1 Tax=Solibaculum mannosilyticum TaxID=2780922 RepID=A0A7I8D6F0_9FIRM|nr:energy-coupling factor ABC transporter ATP-binding protein [Solibaculum mannosilyticum]BCI60224.1 ABC transporter ATP-binding protein [Solibaculum mannosilyticum]